MGDRTKDKEYKVTVNYVQLPEKEQEERVRKIISALVEGVISKLKDKNWLLRVFMIYYMTNEKD